MIWLYKKERKRTFFHHFKPSLYKTIHVQQKYRTHDSYSFKKMLSSYHPSIFVYLFESKSCTALTTAAQGLDRGPVS